MLYTSLLINSNKKNKNLHVLGTELTPDTAPETGAELEDEDDDAIR